MDFAYNLPVHNTPNIYIFKNSPYSNLLKNALLACCDTCMQRHSTSSDLWTEFWWNPCSADCLFYIGSILLADGFSDIEIHINILFHPYQLFTDVINQLLPTDNQLWPPIIARSFHSFKTLKCCLQYTVCFHQIQFFSFLPTKEQGNPQSVQVQLKNAFRLATNHGI